MGKLGLQLPAVVGTCQEPQAGREGSGRARTKMRAVVTTEKNNPKPKTMALRGRSAHVRVGNW